MHCSVAPISDVLQELPSCSSFSDNTTLICSDSVPMSEVSKGLSQYLSNCCLTLNFLVQNMDLGCILHPTFLILFA